MPSTSWVEFIGRLREVAALWQADPASPYRHATGGAPNLRLSNALTKASILLTSAHLQGYVESACQEFLDQVDHSGVDAGQIPARLRGELCLRFPATSPNAPRWEKAEEVHRAYAALWDDGQPLPANTIKSDSLPDPIWNPWPKKINELLSRADIDLFHWLEQRYGPTYLADVVTYGEEVVDKRNKLAHGDNSVQAAISDLTRYLRASARIARGCDEAMDAKLMALCGAGWP